MRITSINRNVAAAAAVIGSLAMLPATEAAVLYDIDFSTLTEAPADWTPLSPTTNLGGWKLSDGGYGYVRDNNGQVNGGVASYNGQVEGGASATSLTDYTLDTYFWKSSAGASNFTGLTARVQDASNYYTAFLNASNQLFIRKVADGNNADLTTVTLSSSYTANETWRLTFTVLGDQLEANVYDSNGQLAGSATASDSAYTSGTFGLRVQTSVGYGLFESLTASTAEVSEPLLVVSPESGYVFDLGEFELGEGTVLSNAITVSNEGTGTITRTGATLTNNEGLWFDIQGFTSQGSTIGAGQTHNYNVAFTGADIAGVYESVATIRTTEGDISYTLRATVVPEPAAISLLGLAGLGLISRRMRRLG